MSTALGGCGRCAAFLWLLLLLVTAAAQAAPTSEAKLVIPEPHHLQIGVEDEMMVIPVKGIAQQSAASPPPLPPIAPPTTKTSFKIVDINAFNITKKSANHEIATTTTTSTTTMRPKATTTKTTATTGTGITSKYVQTSKTPGKITTTAKPILNSILNQSPHNLSPVVHLLDLEHTEAPLINSGHDGEKLTKKKQLQQDNYPKINNVITTTRPPDKDASIAATTTTTTTTTTIESEMERIPTSPGSISTIKATSTTTIKPIVKSSTLMPIHNGYLGPIFMGEKTFSVSHPLRKPQPPNQHQEHESSIESQLRNGRIVEILAPTALLEQSSIDRDSTSIAPPTAPPSSLKLSTTVFQVADMQTSTSTTTTKLSTSGSSETLAAPQMPRTESKISDIQIEVYDSTVDSIVASTNFRDNEGYYSLPLESAMGTTKPPTQPIMQERFTQYVIDRADVSTQPASGMSAVRGGMVGVDKPVPAAIEIHINVSEAFGNESEDLEFSYRQPNMNDKSNKPSDEILVVEIIDNGDNSTENSASAEHINPIFTFRSDPAVAPPAIRPPQLPPDADELFMADLKGDPGVISVPRPPPPPPPPPPRKPSTIDRDSDTIFYISNTEVKVGESLPTVSSGLEQQQRKMQLENQFFPANYVMERTSAATPRYEEDIILSPLHNTADTLKIFRSGTGGGDGAPPLDVTYVGESVIEVEQQGSGQIISSTVAPVISSSSTQLPDIIIQPAVLPDLAIGVPVIGELPPQIELKEIDYMPGEFGLSPSGIGIYENDIQGNGLNMDMGGAADSDSGDPDVVESSIQYGGDLIDDGAGGGFDGVEGSYPFDSPAHRMQQAVAPIHHHLHRENEPVAEMLNATLLQHNESGGGVVVGTGSIGGASAMAPLLANGSQMPERMGNATALSEDPLADFDGFLNLFAVSMGLIIVILPSALLVSMYCAVRYMLNKNTTTGAQGDDSEQGQEPAKNESSSLSPSSSTPAATAAAATATAATAATATTAASAAPSIYDQQHHQQVMAHCVQPIKFQFQKAATMIKDTIDDDDDDDVSIDVDLVLGPNGSITKMTLKDNHLIIVTEERHDISRNARETKMHTDKDGVFVVEVARGIDAKQMPDSPGVETTELPFDTKQQVNGLHVLNEQSLPPSHEQVQIHAPPSDFANSQPTITASVGGTSSTLHLIEEEEQQLNDPEQEQDHEQETIAASQAQTGLSQSDLSSTSSGDSNKRYTYGNQELYIIEQPGYVTTSPTAHPIIPSSPLATPSAAPAENLNNGANNNEQETDNGNSDSGQVEPVVGEPENMAMPPAEFGNHQAETDAKEPRQEENTYDSLMSLPAPPSTEEIKELNDFTLIESNQLDSLPPPPPPTDANGNGHEKFEPGLEMEVKLELETESEGGTAATPIISNGNTNSRNNSNSSNNSKVAVASVTVSVTQPTDEPGTLTPPDSPPATPPPQPPTTTATIYGSGNGQLSNGIHSMPVDVNGS